MEYIEMPAAPKGMFDKLMSNDGSRVPFNTYGSASTGFRPMPVPLFSHGKPLPSMGMPPAAPSGNVSNGNSGTSHIQAPGESGSSQQGEELAEKGKRSKGDGGRGNRGGGTCSRKRTRTVQPDSAISDALPDGSLSGGGAASAGRPVIGNGTRQLQNSNQEKADKAMSRRHSGHSARRGDKKQTQMVATSVNDAPPPKPVEANGVPNNWSSGILDIYGLRTRAMDVSRFMVDIPLNSLLSGEFEVPSFYLKDSYDAKVELEEGFEQQIESVLRVLRKRSANGETRPLKTSDGSLSAKGSKNVKMMLDLEHPLHPEEEDVVPKVGKTDKEMQSDLTSEAGAGREGCTDSLGDGSRASPSPSNFSLDSLPIHSVEGFLSRLNLVPSEPLPSLIALVGADIEMSAAVDIRVGGDIVDVCHRNGSVPPLLVSYPHVGPVKSDNGRYNPRIWMRSPAEFSSLKGGNGVVGKEGSDGVGEDGPNSPSSMAGKVDSKYKVQSPEATQRSNSRTSSMSPGQMDPSRVPSIADPSSAIKDEPRQVDNAVALSSGNLTSMDIDSSRVDSCSAVGSAADATQSVQAATESDRQRSGGEAVRPLETPDTLARPQETDTPSDWQGKPSAGASPEVKVDKVEQKIAVKDPVEEESRETNLVSSGSLALPVVDLKINIRSPCPPQIDPSTGLTGTAIPLSPSVVSASRLIMSFTNPAFVEQDKSEGEKERRRRVFQPYPGAPTQKTTKSVRVSNSATPGDGGREGRRSLDGGSVPPSKALVTERRKSLSQVNDASEKPSYSSPRNSSGGGMSTIRGGIHTGSRSNTPSIKLEKVTARESTKESTSTKEPVGRGSSSLPPLSHGGPPLKNGHKGVKTNSYLHSSNSKGSLTAANLSKVPPPSNTQRIGNGGTSSRSSRVVHTGSSPASHSVAPVPFKSSRQNIPESRQKLKSELSGRGGKPN